MKFKLKVDTSSLRDMPRRLRRKFTEGYGLEAMGRVTAQLEADIKRKITENGSVITGNMRNEVEADPSIPRGDTITGSVTANAEYSSFVNDRKPFIEPPLRLIVYRTFRTEFKKAMDKFAVSENGR